MADKTFDKRSLISNYNNNVFVEKLNKGFYKTWCKCDSKPEYSIKSANTDRNDRYSNLFAIDHGNFLLRMLCPTSYPTEINIYDEISPQKRMVAKIIRPSDLFCFQNIGACKCCCFQKVTVQHSDGRSLGSTKETCWASHPTFDVLDQNENQKYVLSPPLCCMGIFADISPFDYCIECQVPMFIFPPGVSKTRGNEVGKINRMFPGAFNECCTGSTKEHIEFPADIDTDSKIQLLGAHFLLNNVFFQTCQPLRIAFSFFGAGFLSDCLHYCVSGIILDLDSVINQRDSNPYYNNNLDDSFSSDTGLIQMSLK